MRAPQRLYDGFLPGRHVLDAYGVGGFRFGEMSHRGSILALPSGIHAWAAKSFDDLTFSAFQAVVAEAKAIDILLIGTGETPQALDEALRWQLRDAGLRFDAMASAAAARTYNVLLAENRRVAAALLAVA